MPDRLMRARLYRERAEQLRAVAQDWVNDETMRTLSRIAHDYDRMAENLERAARADGMDPAR